MARVFQGLQVFEKQRFILKIRRYDGFNFGDGEGFVLKVAYLAVPQCPLPVVGVERRGEHDDDRCKIHAVTAQGFLLKLFLFLLAFTINTCLEDYLSRNLNYR